MPDKYADEVEFLNHVLDFFIIDKAEFWCNVIRKCLSQFYV